MELTSGTNKVLSTLVIFLLPPLVRMHFKPGFTCSNGLLTRTSEYTRYSGKFYTLTKTKSINILEKSFASLSQKLRFLPVDVVSKSVVVDTVKVEYQTIVVDKPDIQKTIDGDPVNKGVKASGAVLHAKPGIVDYVAAKPRVPIKPYG